MNEEIFDFISDRITKLRESKGVSARDMSLSIGQNEAYINRIENRKTKPSIDGLTFICEYFNISLSEFFDTETENPALLNKLIKSAKGLDNRKLENLIALIQDFGNDK